MDNYLNFQPENEEEAQYVNKLNAMSTIYSKAIREMGEEKRLPFLRERNLIDVHLMHLYLKSHENEDYETSAVAKVLLEERGITAI